MRRGPGSLQPSTPEKRAGFAKLPSILGVRCFFVRCSAGPRISLSSASLGLVSWARLSLCPITIVPNKLGRLSQTSFVSRSLKAVTSGFESSPTFRIYLRLELTRLSRTHKGSCGLVPRMSLTVRRVQVQGIQTRARQSQKPQWCVRVLIVQGSFGQPVGRNRRAPRPLRPRNREFHALQTR